MYDCNIKGLDNVEKFNEWNCFLFIYMYFFLEIYFRRILLG